jgi:pilus assembly protein Flp/PilA
MTKLASFLRDESGAAAAEYVLLLAIIGGGIFAAATAFGGSISTALGNAGAALEGMTFAVS